MIRVGTKQAELARDYENGGNDYSPGGCPDAVTVHDFADWKPGKVVPYSVHDIPAKGATGNSCVIRSEACATHRHGGRRPHVRSVRAKADSPPPCHGRATEHAREGCPGHPRLTGLASGKVVDGRPEAQYGSLWA